MDLATISMRADEARDRYQEWTRYGTTEEDAEIARGYEALARGVDVIRLDDAISAGGCNDLGQPNLAVMKADERWCYLNRQESGAVRFARTDTVHDHYVTGIYRFPRGTLERRPSGTWGLWTAVRAMVPIVPPDLRPRGRRLSRYVVLWEVEEGGWHRYVPPAPKDPALLEHIGGQLYAVLATWDLTELERAVLAGRIA